MFEIPDDDENFWEELPLEDITNSKHESGNKHSFSCGGKRLSSESTDFNQTKRHRPGNVQSPEFNVINTSSPKQLRNQIVESLACREPDQGNSFRSPLSHQGGQDFLSLHSLHPNNVHIYDKIPRSLGPSEDRVPAVSQHIVGQQTNEPVKDVLARLKSRTKQENNAQTPARGRRKFPGPAGLLPKICPGNIKDNTCMAKKFVSTSPEVVRQDDDSVILSSHSGEEVFNDTPWQTLLIDLGEDGRKLIKQFSIATSLQKTRKKLLPKGKVPLVLALIESVDWQGSDASVCLKDKSGKVQGTIHHSLMKDHQCDLQPGTAVVLRQVSMISPSARNHYLNVTPSNIVAIYSNSSNGLRTVKNFAEDKLLSSALSNIEPYLTEENNTRRLSGLNSPVTPQVGGGPRPRLNSPQSLLVTQNQRPTFTPGPVQALSSGTYSSTIRTPQSVKPVNSPQVPGQRLAFVSGLSGNCNFGANGPPFSTQQQPLTQIPQRPPSSNKFRFIKTPSVGNSAISTSSHNSAMNMSNACSMNHNKSESTPSMYTNGANKQVFNRDNSQTRPFVCTMNLGQKPSFNRNICSTDFSTNNDTLSAKLGGNNFDNQVSLRPPLVSPSVQTTRQHEPATINTCSNGSAKKSFKFKSSESNISPENNSLPGTTSLREPPRPFLEAESLWQDDLSDDLLSQLSEEMI